MTELDKLKSFFQVLGDASRLKIVNFIAENECSVNEIAEAIKLSQPLVSHHLRVLRDSQILETKRAGPFVYHRLKDRRLLQALGLFSEIANSITGEIIENPMFCFPAHWKKHWLKF